MIKFWKDRIRSFGFATEGLKYLFSNEGNAKVHLMAVALVTAAGFVFHISSLEWIAVLLCIAMVICGEAMNTAIEKLCDKVSPDKDPLIKIAKDVAAGGVLIAAIISVIIAAIVFLPKIFTF